MFVKIVANKNSNSNKIPNLSSYFSLLDHFLISVLFLTCDFFKKNTIQTSIFRSTSKIPVFIRFPHVLICSIFFFFVLKFFYKTFFSKYKEIILLAKSPTELFKPPKKKKKNYKKNLKTNFFKKMKFNKSLKIELEEMINISIDKKKKQSIILTGPTGCGKTETAILIGKLRGEYMKINLSNLMHLETPLILEILNSTVSKCEKKKIPLIFDDGDIGLIEKKQVNEAIKENNKAEKHMRRNKKKKLGGAAALISGFLLSVLIQRDILFIFTTNSLNSIDENWARRFNFFINYQKQENKILIEILFNYIGKRHLFDCSVQEAKTFFLKKSANLSSLCGRNLLHVKESIDRFEKIKKRRLKLSELWELINEYIRVSQQNEDNKIHKNMKKFLRQVDQD